MNSTALRSKRPIIDVQALSRLHLIETTAFLIIDERDPEWSSCRGPFNQLVRAKLLSVVTAGIKDPDLSTTGVVVSQWIANSPKCNGKGPINHAQKAICNLDRGIGGNGCASPKSLGGVFLRCLSKLAVKTRQQRRRGDKPVLSVFEAKFERNVIV